LNTAPLGRRQMEEVREATSNEPMIATTSKNDKFDAPEGDYRGKLCRATTVPNKTTAAGTGEDRIRLVFEIESPAHPGRRYLAGKNYEPSLAKDSKLREDLASWRGHDLMPREKANKAVDFEGMVGRPADLIIEHCYNNRYAKPFVSIKAIYPPGTLIRYGRDSRNRLPDGVGLEGVAEKAAPEESDAANRVGVAQAAEGDDALPWL
jgi:hypothetical protein